MSLLVALFGLLISILGVICIIDPERLVDLARSWQTQTGIYIIAAFRVVMGVLLVLVAPDSRAPQTLRVFGVIILISGLVTPFFGLARFHQIVEWWAVRSLALKRAWGILAFALGLLLMYAVIPLT